MLLHYSAFVCIVCTGPNNSVFSPHNLAKNLTPTLLKTRRRFETMSAGSTTDTEGGISPLWECEEVCMTYTVGVDVKEYNLRK